MSKKRRLRPEEKDIWRKVIRDVKPLGPVEEGERLDRSAHRLAQSLEMPADKKGARAPRILLGREKPKAFANSKGMQKLSAAGDPKTFKRMARERASIEAICDLHGLTQDQAFGELKMFFARCRDRGMRHVLIITGKGPAIGRENVHYHGGRGILRFRFLQWAEEQFRSDISAMRPAQPKHGGAGAFYVTLKRKAKPTGGARGFFTQ